jgi:hypothetical protein
MPTTLEQFTNNRRDLTTHRRTGLDVFPDHEASAELERVALEHGVKASAIPEIFFFYTGDPKRKILPEFNLGDSYTAWLEEMKAGARPHLFTTSDSYALAAEAFSENGVMNLSARSKLILEVGEKQAEAMAVQWGLQPTGPGKSALQDFKTHGKRPDPANQTMATEALKLQAEIDERQAKLNQIQKAIPPPAASSNPFDRLTGEALAKWLEGAVKAMGTARVAAIAAAAHPPRRIDGSIVPAKFR